MESLVAYLSMLKKHGVKRSEVFRREHVARILIGRLNGEAVTNPAYRAAVGDLVDNMGNEANRAFSVMVAREFFPFLVRDVRLIAKISECGGYRDGVVLPDGMSEMSFATLDEFVASARGYECGPDEEMALSRYGEFLGKMGVGSSAHGERMILARGLLLLLHGVPVNGNTYRLVVDRVSMLFRHDEARGYFMNVAREVFPFIRHEDGAGRSFAIAT